MGVRRTLVLSALVLWIVATCALVASLGGSAARARAVSTARSLIGSTGAARGDSAARGLVFAWSRDEALRPALAVRRCQALGHGAAFEWSTVPPDVFQLELAALTLRNTVFSALGVTVSVSPLCAWTDEPPTAADGSTDAPPRSTLATTLLSASDIEYVAHVLDSLAKEQMVEYFAAAPGSQRTFGDAIEALRLAGQRADTLPQLLDDAVVAFTSLDERGVYGCTPGAASARRAAAWGLAHAARGLEAVLQDATVAANAYGLAVRHVLAAVTDIKRVQADASRRAHADHRARARAGQKDAPPDRLAHERAERAVQLADELVTSAQSRLAAVRAAIELATAFAAQTHASVHVPLLGAWTAWRRFRDALDARTPIGWAWFAPAESLVVRADVNVGAMFDAAPDVHVIVPDIRMRADARLCLPVLASIAVRQSERGRELIDRLLAKRWRAWLGGPATALAESLLEITVPNYAGECAAAGLVHPDDRAPATYCDSADVRAYATCFFTQLERASGETVLFSDALKDALVLPPATAGVDASRPWLAAAAACTHISAWTGACVGAPSFNVTCLHETGIDWQ